jgi:hypothetical protein
LLKIVNPKKLVYHEIYNQQAAGSSPIASSNKFK